MKWTRPEPGTYLAGPYKVERQPYHRAIWIATGPGLPETGAVHETKDDAQTEAEDAALARITAPDYHVAPVVGDVVVEGGKRGHISAILPNANGGSPTFVIQLPRGRRKCRLRPEFPVVMP